MLIRESTGTRRLEHLLLALIACKVDSSALTEKLTNYIDNVMKTLGIGDYGGEPKQSAGLPRVVQRAAHYAEGRGVLHGPVQSLFWRYWPKQIALLHDF